MVSAVCQSISGLQIAHGFFFFDDDGNWYFFIFFSSKIFILLYFIRKTRCTIVIRMVLFPCRFHSLLDSVKFGFIIICVCVCNVLCVTAGHTVGIVLRLFTLCIQKERDFVQDINIGKEVIITAKVYLPEKSFQIIRC